MLRLPRCNMGGPITRWLYVRHPCRACRDQCPVEMRSDQVVERMTCDREHRLAIAFGVVKTIEQVDTARS